MQAYRKQLSAAKLKLNLTPERITVIIPCYRHAGIVDRCLRSFANQELAEYIDITLVNDCSPYTDNDYVSVTTKYADKLSVQCLRTSTNVGPGDARQYGLDHTAFNNNYILFIDDDEEIISQNGLTPLFNEITNNKFIVLKTGYVDCYTDSEGNLFKNNVSCYDNDKISGFCVKRSLLDKYSLRFPHDLSYFNSEELFLLETQFCSLELCDSLIRFINSPSFNVFSSFDTDEADIAIRYDWKTSNYIAQYIILLAHKILLGRQYGSTFVATKEFNLSLKVLRYYISTYTIDYENRDLTVKQLKSLRDLCNDLLSYFKTFTVKKLINTVNEVDVEDLRETIIKSKLPFFSCIAKENVKFSTKEYCELLLETINKELGY